MNYLLGLWSFYILAGILERGLLWWNFWISPMDVKCVFTYLSVPYMRNTKIKNWVMEFISLCQKYRHYHRVFLFNFFQICYIVFSFVVFIKRICFQYVGWQVLFSKSFSQLSFILSTWVSWYMHCLDVKFAFNSSVLFVSHWCFWVEMFQPD